MEAELENGVEGLSSEDSHNPDTNQQQDEEPVNGALSPVSNGAPVDANLEKEQLEAPPAGNETPGGKEPEPSGDGLPKDAEVEQMGKNEESPQGDRRMSLRPRSTPKKYNDIPEVDVDDDRRRSKAKDRVAGTELVSQRKQPSSTVVIQMNSTSTRGAKGAVKTPKVTRPPPELLKAPIRQLSSSTSVTVVSKPKDSNAGLVLVNTQSSSARKSAASLVPASVTVSTVSSPSRPAGKGVLAPRQRAPAVLTSPPPTTVDLYDKLGLSDDSYIVEAPSFVVPYLIEKTGEKDLKKSLQTLQDSEKPAASKTVEHGEDETEKDEKEGGVKEPSEDPAEKKVSDEPPTNTPKPEEKEKEEEDYFSGAIGKFFLDIGLSLVQEYVQEDLLRIQKRKVSKGKKISDPSLRVPALERNLEMTRSKNAPLKIKLRQCDRCNFRSESSSVLAHHWSSPLTIGSGPMTKYVCQLCDYEAGDIPHVALHIQQDHQLRPLVEPDLSYHQCPLCPFEDGIKGKVSRHVASCQKRFIPQKNLEPPTDWEPPAKIPRLPARGLQAAAAGLNAAALGGAAAAGGKGAVPFALPSYHLLLPKSAIASQAAAAASPGYRILPNVQGQQGFLPGTSNTPRGLKSSPASMSGLKLPAELHVVQNAQSRAGLPFATKGSSLGRQANPSAHSLYSQAVYQQLLQAQGSAMSIIPSTSSKGGGLASGLKKSNSAISLVPGLVSNKGLSIQGTPSPASRSRTSQQPSISITPLPRSSSTPSTAGGKNSSSSSSAPATPATSKTGGKNSISCEICDGVIKDMEQLRHHMQWIHKVKIHPKMIHNRPPLNCQKCQSRFFTDQGLERHLLGSHGLVTSSMQEAANRGQDGGRCPICGKVHQWKLLSHVVKDHGLTLKPAHLSYKCTVCTATFGMYKLFETHVYTAHSVVARKVLDKDKDGGKESKTSGAPLRINDEITIIPQPTGGDAAEQAICRLCGGSYDPAEAKRQLRKLHNAGSPLPAGADKSCASCLKKHAKKEDRHASKVDVIDLSDDESKNVSLPKSQVTITKVPAASKGEPPEKRPKT